MLTVTTLRNSIMHAARMHYHKIPHKGKVKRSRVVYNWFSLFSVFFFPSTGAKFIVCNLCYQ